MRLLLIFLYLLIIFPDYRSVYAKDVITDWLTVSKNNYVTRPKIGLTLGYTASIIQSSGYSPYGRVELLNDGVGRQVWSEMWYKVIDTKYFLVGGKFGANTSGINGDGASKILLFFSPTSNRHRVAYLSTVYYGQIILGININPSLNAYLAVGVAGSVQGQAMEKHAIVGVGFEWRLNGRLGMKVEYNCLLNEFNHVLFGAQAFHMVSFGLNFYLL